MSTSGELLRERGSFRDPGNQVFDGGDAVYRALSEEALADWRSLAATPLARDPRLVATEEVEHAPAGWAGLLRHERIPFVSYPYEWPFSTLKRAALLTLDLLVDAIGAGLTLKDGTPYNVQLRGPRPVFIDVGSFERLREGEPWAGYRQFCQLQLYPLLLQALLDVPYQPWLRGALEGITPTEMRNLIGFRARLHKGVLTHVVLHARLEQRYSVRSREVKSELREAGFKKELLVANARGLRRAIERLDWNGESAAWSDYGQTWSYDEANAATKADFVRGAVESVAPSLVWDLGCNDGTYSKIAAAAGANVVALDGDHPVVDRLAREENERILPLVVDLAAPSPSLGWRGAERKHLLARGKPELTLVLALVHHLSITRNIPLAELVDWLADLGGSLVVEFVEPRDPMAQKLLAAKREGTHDDYTRATFERALGNRFEVERSVELVDGLRVLYLAHPRS